MASSLLRPPTGLLSKQEDSSDFLPLFASTHHLTRSDILDNALLRPGRFDRRVQVGLPDVKGRAQILEVHVKNKKLDGEITLMDIAKRTAGFSGADLENLMNESAILAARRNKKAISMDEINDATDRVIAGLEGRALQENVQQV